MSNKTHPLYSTWKNMMARCYVKSNTSYKYYGAVGVTVCDRWHDFWNFVEDVETRLENGNLLYQKEYHLDKDLKGGMIYSLENCVVSLASINRNLPNKKKQKKIVAIKDDEMIEFDSITEASKVLGIKRGVIQSCLSTEYNFKYF